MIRSATLTSISSRPKTPTIWLVDLGHFVEKHLALAFGQAAGDDHALDLTEPLAVEHLADHAQRLLPGRVDEPARVDDDKVGRPGIRDEGIAILRPRRPSIRSESTRFFGQPRLTNENLAFISSLLFIPFIPSFALHARQDFQRFDRSSSSISRDVPAIVPPGFQDSEIRSHMNGDGRSTDPDHLGMPDFKSPTARHVHPKRTKRFCRDKIKNNSGCQHQGLRIGRQSCLQSESIDVKSCCA